MLRIFAVGIIAGQVRILVDAEAGVVTPRHDGMNHCPIDFVFFVQCPQHCGTKHVAQRPQVHPRQYIKNGTLGKQAVGGQNMQMGVPYAVIPEGLDRRDSTDLPFRQLKSWAKKPFQALVGAAAEISQQGTVVFEMEAQDFRDTEDILPVRNQIEDGLAQLLAELNPFFGVATGAEPTAAAAEGQQALMAAVGAAYPGETLEQVAALEIRLLCIFQPCPLRSHKFFPLPQNLFQKGSFYQALIH